MKLSSVSPCIFTLLVSCRGCLVERERGFPQSHITQEITTQDLIKQHGYPVERHFVTTEDGYILQLQRIPHRPYERRNPKDSRPAVLVLHGLFCSSAAWVIQGPKRALAYILADNGYDVWLMNFRGSTYSANHTKWHPDSLRFWDFSWHEMGIYDLPNTIDYIQKVAQPSFIDVIGFSMGSTVFFVSMSERPEYNKKVRKMVALAPSSFGKDSQGLLRESAIFWKSVQLSTTLFGVRELPPPFLKLNQNLNNACDPYNPIRFFCDLFFTVLERSIGAGLRQDLFHVFFKIFPNTVSPRTLTHYHRVYLTDNFGQYDYGPQRNLRTYGTITPPSYNLTQITTPMYFFWSRGDVIISPKAMMRVSRIMPGHKASFEITAPNFSHASFSMGINVEKFLYPKILNILLS